MNDLNTTGAATPSAAAAKPRPADLFPPTSGPDVPPGKPSAQAPADFSRLWTLAQAASFLCMTQSALRGMLHRGTIPATCVFRIGRRIRFDMPALKIWLEGLRGSNNPGTPTGEVKL